jgi:hypothetical protein
MLLTNKCSLGLLDYIVQFNSIHAKPRRCFDPARPPVLFEEDLESEEKW